MYEKIDKFLKEFFSDVNLENNKASEILFEFKSHLYESSKNLEEEGWGHEESQIESIKKLGNLKKLKRRLLWIHGFGRLSGNIFKDVFLAILPFFLFSVLFLIDLIGISISFLPRKTLWDSYHSFLLLLVIFVSFYAYKNGAPLWTIPWLGFLNVLWILIGSVLFVLFFKIAIFYWLVLIILSFIFIFSIYFVSKRNFYLLPLYLLPLAFPWIASASDEIVPPVRFTLQLSVSLFCIFASGIYIISRLKYLKTVLVSGFIFYSILYYYILFEAPLTFTTGTNFIGIIPAAMGYILPCLIISISPMYILIKKKFSIL
ncbi:MAG: hypothetical protein AB1410_02760 [Acidobacteriota bacterium]